MEHRDVSVLYRGLKELHLDITKEQEEQFVKYYELLIKKNKVMNLTSITDFNEVLVKHFIDSLSIVKVVDMTKVKELIDVGTGAGFPGVPIKIMYPHIHLVLADSLMKRVKFLEESCFMIGLRNTDCVHGRAEDLGQDKKYREQFDLCVSRAVANLSTLSEYCVPFVKKGGNFVAYKAGGVENEIEAGLVAIGKLGGKLAQKIEFTLPESDSKRVLLRVEKETSTNIRYPRKAGLPAKEPLH